MSSQRKIEANRRNAQFSTGPRTPEGKAAVAGNAVTHGLRAKKALLYFESYSEFDKVCCDLTEEWQPETPTEANLIEQMATAQLKLVRLESNLSHAFYQSFAMKCAACEDEITDPDGTIKPPDFIVDREFKVQRLINGLSQHIARVERAWHKALDTLQKLQDRRRKEASRRPQTAPAEPQSPGASASGAGIAEKNVEPSHPEGVQILRKQVGSSASGGSEPDLGLPLDALTSA